MGETDNQDYEQFKQLFFQLTGINLSLYKEEQMRRRLNSLRLRKGIASFTDYARRLQTDKALMDEILSRMTINVTEFFRNRPRWEVLEEKIRQRLSSHRPLTIWSAACSTGEEPYSLAILCSKYLPAADFSITATDIDHKVLEMARQGTYLEKALENLTAAERKYFKQEGPFFAVDASLKQSIRFMQHDLLSDPAPGRFDFVVCRNVLIYFTDEGKNTIYHKLSAALEPGGTLFVGSTEQIFSPVSFGLRAAETFFYEKIK